VAGKQTHGDLSEFFPDAVSAECKGDGQWAELVCRDERGDYQTSAECPLCAKEKLAAAILRFTPPRFRAPVEIPAAVAEWAGRGRKAQGLYLAGQVGTGKTHTAWMALAAWCQATGTRPHGEEPPSIDWGGPSVRTAPNVVFTRLTDLLDNLRPGEAAVQTIRDCQRAVLLVIDDIGAEKPSEWTQERVYSVIDHRYAGCMPLIVTSNLPPSKLADQVGERAASRLAEMCEVVAMTGTDRRKPGA
jgi:DNA replication protein DnaC